MPPVNEFFLAIVVFSFVSLGIAMAYASAVAPGATNVKKK